MSRCILAYFSRLSCISQKGLFQRINTLLHFTKKQDLVWQIINNEYILSVFNISEILYCNFRFSVLNWSLFFQHSKESAAGEKLCKAIDAGLKSTHLSSRIATLHGILYLLEAGMSEITKTVVPMTTDFLLRNISIVSQWVALMNMMDNSLKQYAIYTIWNHQTCFLFTLAGYCLMFKC